VNLDPWVPWGSHHYINNNLSWSDVKATHVGGDLNRQEKIRYVIRPYIDATGNHPSVIVCNDPHRGAILNCGKCEKCSRTIAGLMLEGIDPNRCGLYIDDGTFGAIRTKILDPKRHFLQLQPNMWRDIQGLIPGKITDDQYGSKVFFNWLRTYHIPVKGKEKVPILQSIKVMIPKKGP
jgi:hypothetical protein